MHTVELLEHAIAVAKSAKLQVRQEWLDGGSAGFCRIGKQYWLFVDVSLSAAEQLEQVIAGLRQVRWEGLTMPPELRQLLNAAVASLEGV